MSRTLSGLFLVGAVNRPRTGNSPKSPRTNRENPGKIGKGQKRTKKDQKGQKRTKKDKKGQKRKDKSRSGNPPVWRPLKRSIAPLKGSMDNVRRNPPKKSNSRSRNSAPYSPLKVATPWPATEWVSGLQPEIRKQLERTLDTASPRK